MFQFYVCNLHVFIITSSIVYSKTKSNIISHSTKHILCKYAMNLIHKNGQIYHEKHINYSINRGFDHIERNYYIIN